MYIRTLTYNITHTHTCTNTCTNACTHVHSCKFERKNTHARTHTPAYAQSCAITYDYTYIHIYTHTHTHANTRTPMMYYVTKTNVTPSLLNVSMLPSGDYLASLACHKYYNVHVLSITMYSVCEFIAKIAARKNKS